MAYHWPAGLAMLADPTWQLAPHLKALCHALLEVAAGRVKCLLVTVPPGHGKSTVVSRYFPTWHMGRFPRANIMLVSHEAKYAESYGRSVRELLSIYGPEIFGVTPKSKPAAADWWEIAHHGGAMYSVGIEGPVTGKRVHGLIIDDPVKDEKDARSPTLRNRRWEWYRSTARTRLEPGGWVIIVMTRWHIDDIAGRLLDLKRSGLEDWTTINFPAIAEENDALGRQPGEALWPERFPAEDLQKTRAVLGSYWWNALYQQRPSPQEGTLFRREFFRYWAEAEGQPGILELGQLPGQVRYVAMTDCTTFVTADLAISLNDRADYFVACAWALTPAKDLVLLDLIRARIDGPQQIVVLQGLQRRWRPEVHRIESNQYQLSLVQHALKEGLNAKPCRAKGDKFAHAQGIAARMEAGKVFIPRSATPWKDTLEDELVNFPSAPHDDQVDNFSMAGDYVAEPEGRIGLAGMIKLSRREGRAVVVKEGPFYPWERDS